VPSLSADGRYVVAGSPVPYDRATNSFVVVPGGTPAGATISFVDSISSDGRYVFFTSATPLGSGSPASCSPTVCVYRQDVADGNISFIHVGQVGVRSADGNVVAYLEGSGDVYVKNFYANTTYLLIDHSFWQNTASDIYGLSADGLALGVMTSALSDFTQAYVTSGSRPVADTTPPTLGMHLWVNNPKHSPKLPV